MASGLRKATEKDLDSITELFARAFFDDPFTCYATLATTGRDESLPARGTDWSKLPDRRLAQHYIFYQSTVRATYLMGGTIEVVADSKTDRPLAVAMWLPPKRRIKVWNVSLMFRSGFIHNMIGLGWTGIKRVAFEFMSTAEHIAEKAYRSRGDRSPENTLYLQLIAVDPEEEGHGYMSLLMRSNTVGSATVPLYLEATTPKSRDRYLHFGYETLGEFAVGASKVDDKGWPATGDKATGLPIYVMTKWDATK